MVRGKKRCNASVYTISISMVRTACHVALKIARGLEYLLENIHGTYLLVPAYL
jgi:hypothetical protein